MQKYRIKKSPAIIVEAVQLTADNVDALANWAQAQIVQEGRIGAEAYGEGLNVKTPNGKERLHQGMYLVKIGSDFYTSSAINFEMRYEPVPAVEKSAPKLTDDPWKDVPRIKDVP